MAKRIWEKGERIVATEDCGSWNKVSRGTEGVVKEHFYAGEEKVKVEFTREGAQYVYPEQIGPV